MISQFYILISLAQTFRIGKSSPLMFVTYSFRICSTVDIFPKVNFIFLPHTVYETILKIHYTHFIITCLISKLTWTKGSWELFQAPVCQCLSVRRDLTVQFIGAVWQGSPPQTNQIFFIRIRNFFYLPWLGLAIVVFKALGALTFSLLFGEDIKQFLEEKSLVRYLSDIFYCKWIEAKNVLIEKKADVKKNHEWLLNTRSVTKHRIVPSHSTLVICFLW